MKKELTTVYVPVKEYKEYSISYKNEEGTYDFVEKQKLITFTREEYNQMLEEFGKEILKKALINSKMQVVDSIMNKTSLKDYITSKDLIVKIDKDSITNTLPQILNEWKV